MIKWEFNNWHKMYKDQSFRKLIEFYIDVLKAKEIFISTTSSTFPENYKKYLEDLEYKNLEKEKYVILGNRM